MEVRVYILFCRRSQDSDGIAEQVFLYKKNAEKRQAEYQSQYKKEDEISFYIKPFIIEDWEQFLSEQD